MARRGSSKWLLGLLLAFSLRVLAQDGSQEASEGMSQGSSSEAPQEAPQDAVPTCGSTGLDYTDGGSYLIDASVNQSFAFTSVFTSKWWYIRTNTMHSSLHWRLLWLQGCPDGWVLPLLVSPEGTQYNCSEIETQPDGYQQQSTW